MPEYNFWDDRTHETNDETFCPIMNGDCYDRDCDACELREEFDKWAGGAEHA